MSDEPRFEEWAVLELMGHRRLAGRVTEVQIAGSSFLRIDIIGPDGEDEATQFYPPGSVYCLTPCTEDACRAAAGRMWTRPASLIGLPTGAPQYVPRSDREEPDYDDEPF